MEKSFINLLDAPYSRRGSYFAFANDNLGQDVLGKSNLWLCNTRSVDYAMTDFSAPNRFRQLLLQPTMEGRTVAAALFTTEQEVCIRTNWGSFRFCIGERRLVMAKGTDGLGLRITPRPGLMGSSFTPLMDELGRYFADFGLGRVMITPLRGTLKEGPGWLDLLPDGEGCVLAAIEDSLTDQLPRAVESYPSYDECVQNVKEDFDSFAKAVYPSLPEEFEPMRRQALWQTWNMMVEPDGENDYKRTMIKMIHIIFESAFAWQMPMQAVWLHNDPKLSWTVFCSCFDFQDKNGRINDAVAFQALPGRPAMKPPIQGLALLWLMENGVIDAAAPSEEERLWLLERMINWTEFFYKFRDKDGDGLCEYDRALETGWEDAPQYYAQGLPQASPDLNAFLALQLEAIARFGETVGMDESVRQGYLDRSRRVIDKMVEKLWDGEKWTSLCIANGRRSDCDNLTLWLPIVLGDRLPREIVEKSVAHLFREGGFETKYGIITEAMDSKYFRGGFSAGSVITPAHFFVPLGLEACGYQEEARRVALNYCRTLKTAGFFHIYNSLTGLEDRSLTAFGERRLFWSAWTSSCYLFLADRYGK